MNDYMIYEQARQRYAEVIDEVSRARTMRARGYRRRWTGGTASARVRFATFAGILTNRARTPRAA